MKLSELFSIAEMKMLSEIKKELDGLVGKKISFNGRKWCEKGEEGCNEWKRYKIKVSEIKPSPGCGGSSIPYQLTVVSTKGDRYTIPEDADLKIHYEIVHPY